MAKLLQFLPALLLFFYLQMSGQPSQVYARDGVDVSEPLSVYQFYCLLALQSKTFVIVRVWRSVGAVDTNATQTMKNAWAGGMVAVHGYIFPCFKCQGPRGQIRTLLEYLAQSKYGMLWLDIENPASWGSNQSENVEFIREMVNELRAKGKSIGFYTSSSHWKAITGGSTRFSGFPLWYAHYDKEANFEDFVSFGGWTRPAMKQFRGDVGICLAKVDLNWLPSKK